MKFSGRFSKWDVLLVCANLVLLWAILQPTIFQMRTAQRLAEIRNQRPTARVLEKAQGQDVPRTAHPYMQAQEEPLCIIVLFIHGEDEVRVYVLLTERSRSIPITVD